MEHSRLSDGFGAPLPNAYAIEGLKHFFPFCSDRCLCECILYVQPKWRIWTFPHKNWISTDISSLGTDIEIDQ